MKGRRVWLISPFSPVPGEGWGGVKTHAEYLTRLLLSMGAEVTVLMPEKAGGQGRLEGKYAAELVRSGAMPHTRDWRLAVFSSARRLLSRSRPDLVISEGYYAAGCEDLLKAEGVPLAAFVHNFHLVHFHKTWAEVDGMSGFLRYILKAVPSIALKALFVEMPFLRKADIVISVSERNAGLLRRFYRIPAKRLAVLRNWVDTDIFRPDSGRRVAARETLGLKDDAVCFLAVGALWRPKGFRVAVDAFLRLARKFPAAHLLIAGSGPDESVLRSMAGAVPGAGERARFLGNVPLRELTSFYNAADVFVMPSIHPEGLAYTLIEAMACGLPCIATSLGGNIETLGGCGKLVRAGDAGKLAAAMEAFMYDRGADGQRCRDRAVRLFSAGSAAVEAGTIFDAILRNDGRP